MPLRTAMTATTRPLLVHAPGTPASHPHGASGEETTPQLWSRMVRAVLERANAEKEVAEMAGAEQGGARIEQAGPYAGREGVSAGGRGVHAEGRGRAEGVGARARGGRGRAGGRRAVESTHEGKGGRGKQQKISGRNGARSTAAQSFKRDVRSSHDLTTPYLGRSGPITIPRRQITFSRLKSSPSLSRAISDDESWDDYDALGPPPPTPILELIEMANEITKGK